MLSPNEKQLQRSHIVVINSCLIACSCSQRTWRRIRRGNMQHSKFERWNAHSQRLKRQPALTQGQREPGVPLAYARNVVVAMDNNYRMRKPNVWSSFRLW